jgi:hypothetical protein
MTQVSDGAQIKVKVPMPLYRLLRREAKGTGRTMAEIVREELAERYRDEVELGGHREPTESCAGVPALQVG